MKKTKEIIKALNNVGDIEDLTKYENKFICILMGRFFLVASIIWYFLLFFIKKESIILNIISASVFLLTSIVLFIIYISNLNAYIASAFISLIFCLVTLYIFFYLYNF